MEIEQMIDSINRQAINPHRDGYTKRVAVARFGVRIKPVAGERCDG